MSKEENWFYRYAVWAEKQEDDLNDPILYAVVKFLLFTGLPLLLIIAGGLLALVLVISFAISVLPWLWDLVWI